MSPVEEVTTFEEKNVHGDEEFSLGPTSSN
jgi:hypothetical protein